MSTLASQTTLEVLADGQAPVRVSQVVMEALADGQSAVRVTQASLEVLCSLDELSGYVSIAGGPRA